MIFWVLNIPLVGLIGFGSWLDRNSDITQEEELDSVMPLQKYMIERDIPDVGTLERQQLREAAARSNEVLAQLGADIQWLESFVSANRTFCIYAAANEDLIKKHSEISGFPVARITPIAKTIDPTTEKPD